MPLLVVRHARAGDRRGWDGPDEERPLSKRGWKQARALADALASYAPDRILASGHLRCVQTVEPLAARCGVTVERAAALTEGAPAEAVTTLVREVPRSTSRAVALCTHGDVLIALLDALVREDRLELPDGYPHAKGSTWVLLERDGRFVEARYLPPQA